MPPNPKNFNVDNVRVVKIMGGSLAGSRVVRGMVFGREPEGTPVLYDIVRETHHEPRHDQEGPESEGRSVHLRPGHRTNGDEGHCPHPQQGGDAQLYHWGGEAPRKGVCAIYLIDVLADSLVDLPRDRRFRREGHHRWLNNRRARAALSEQDEHRSTQGTIEVRSASSVPRRKCHTSGAHGRAYARRGRLRRRLREH